MKIFMACKPYTNHNAKSSDKMVRLINFVMVAISKFTFT